MGFEMVDKNWLIDSKPIVGRYWTHMNKVAINVFKIKFRDKKVAFE